MHEDAKRNRQGLVEGRDGFSDAGVRGAGQLLKASVCTASDFLAFTFGFSIPNCWCLPPRYDGLLKRSQQKRNLLCFGEKTLMVSNKFWKGKREKKVQCSRSFLKKMIAVVLRQFRLEV
ncbi:hypothetical protein TNCT_639251 [Trichonephila clavata]|uniref:Uncharacterized protein n=1 Tax=Trichonephila clavata TaxID=2740835 RepID=A0A8X6K230_TRICU|nr:hypothetical protein TNCT_639251 [Trichonephila clavata]